MNIYLDYFNANGIVFNNILDNLSKYANSAFYNQSEIVIKDYFIPSNETYTHTLIPISGHIEYMYNGTPIRDWDSTIPMVVDKYDSSTLLPESETTTEFEYSLLGDSILVKHTDNIQVIQFKTKMVIKDSNTIKHSIKEKLEELYYNLSIRSDDIYSTISSLSVVKNNLIAMNTKVKPIKRVKSFKASGISLRT